MSTTNGQSTTAAESLLLIPARDVIASIDLRHLDPEATKAGSSGQAHKDIRYLVQVAQDAIGSNEKLHAIIRRYYAAHAASVLPDPKAKAVSSCSCGACGMARPLLESAGMATEQPGA